MEVDRNLIVEQALAKCAEINAELSKPSAFYDEASLKSGLARANTALNLIRDKKAESTRAFNEQMEILRAKNADASERLEELRRQREMTNLKLEELLTYQQTLGSSGILRPTEYKVEDIATHLDRKFNEIDAEVNSAKERNREAYEQLFHILSADIMRERRVRKLESILIVVLGFLIVLLAK